MKQPAFMFYPADWMSDEKLRACSLAARGLWIEMLCLMHKNDRRGYLQIGGKPASLQQIAQMAGCSTDEASRCLNELETAGVSRTSAHGILYSNRMVEDQKRRESAARNGRLGGNPNLSSRPPNGEVNQEVNRPLNMNMNNSSGGKGSKGKGGGLTAAQRTYQRLLDKSKGDSK